MIIFTIVLHDGLHSTISTLKMAKCPTTLASIRVIWAAKLCQLSYYKTVKMDTSIAIVHNH